MAAVSPPQLVPVDAALRAQLSACTAPSPTGLTSQAAVRFTTALLRTPYGRDHLRHVALVAEGRVLASAVLEQRPAIVLGRTVSVCVAGDVGVHVEGEDPAAHALLRQVIVQAPEFAPGAACLLSTAPSADPPPGFTPVAARELTLVVREDSRRGAPMAPVRSGHRDDLAFIAEYPTHRPSPGGLHFLRDAGTLEYALTRHRLLSGLAPAGVRESWFLVVEEGMRAAAYVVLGVTPGRWTIEDWGDRDPTGARVGAILQTLIAREPAERRPVITTELEAETVPPQLTIAASRPSATSLCAYALDPDLELAGLSSSVLPPA